MAYLRTIVGVGKIMTRPHHPLRFGHDIAKHLAWVDQLKLEIKFQSAKCYPYGIGEVSFLISTIKEVPPTH